MKVLITGIAGFAGSHLAEHLLAQGDAVAGIFLPQFGTANIDPSYPACACTRATWATTREF